MAPPPLLCSFPRDLLPPCLSPFGTYLFARQQYAHIWQCVVALLGHDPPNPVWEVGSLPLHIGGLGLRSAVRTAPAPRWGSWADCLHTISERHAHIAHTMMDALNSPSAAAVHLTGAVRSRASLAKSGFVCPAEPTWPRQGGSRRSFSLAEKKLGRKSRARSIPNTFIS